MEVSRDFKGMWIPREIWLDKRLSLVDKALLAEIDSFSTTEEGCFASNKYFAEFFGVCESTITKSIKKLKDYKLIRVVSFDGRKRRLESNVRLCVRASSVNSIRQTSKIYEAESENVPTINIDYKNNYQYRGNGHPLPKEGDAPYYQDFEGFMNLQDNLDDEGLPFG